MKKLCIILIILILILAIALGIMTYYYFYMRTAYFNSSNTIVKMTEAMHGAGYTIQVEDEGNTFTLVELVE